MDDPECPDLICVSVYDTKPVHVMSSSTECVNWVTMQRNVYSAAANKMVTMEYLRLNLIDNYNQDMNSVDLADQLCNCY